LARPIGLKIPGRGARGIEFCRGIDADLGETRPKDALRPDWSRSELADEIRIAEKVERVRSAVHAVSGFGEIDGAAQDARGRRLAEEELRHRVLGL